MSIYIDTSAFLRAFLQNSLDYAAAKDLLTPASRTLVSSELLWLEADRNAIRLAKENPALADLPQQVTKVLAHVTMIPLTRSTINAARRIPQVIKSLDALHIAAAESLGDLLDCVVTYDGTMTAVLNQRGVKVVTASELAAQQETADEL